MSTRCFTPALANRTLPLVRRIVEDILRKGKELRRIAALRTERNQRQLERLGDEIRQHMNELCEIGCDYKDWSFDVGLVDFPAIINDRPVLLCWRSDEERVEYYHAEESGYAGRRKIPRALLIEESKTTAPGNEGPTTERAEAAGEI